MINRINVKKRKSKVPLQHQGIYEVLFYICNDIYVSKTDRRINIRLEEHKTLVANKDLTHSKGKVEINIKERVSKDYKHTKT